jgi:Na+/proline symporter
MQSVISISIVILYVLILLTIHLVLRKRIEHTLDSFVFTGNNVGTALLAPSVFVAWIWPTSIIGAAEAGIAYGVSGGIAYAFGAGIAFFFMIIIIHRFHSLMPDQPFVSEFIRKRFSAEANTVYLFLMVLISIYLIVEMAAGIGFVFSGLFGVSFKMVTFSIVAFSIIFIVRNGIKGVLINDCINSILILVGFGVIVGLIFMKFDPETLRLGLLDVQNNPENNNYNPEILNYFALGGIRYFVAAIVVGLAQTCFDPAYNLRAFIAKDEKTFLRSFFIGGVLLFCPVALLSSIVLGHSLLVLNIELSEVINLSTIIASKIFIDLLPIWASVLFAFVMLCITMTTISSSLVGILSLASYNIYPTLLKSKTQDEKQILFGRVFTIIIGLICALIAISLEKISLLTLDTFCGILFAAPCSVLIMGLLSKKKLGRLSVTAIFIGATSGFCFWIFQVGL